MYPTDSLDKMMPDVVDRFNPKKPTQTTNAHAGPVAKAEEP